MSRPTKQANLSAWALRAEGSSALETISISDGERDTLGRQLHTAVRSRRQRGRDAKGLGSSGAGPLNDAVGSSMNGSDGRGTTQSNSNGSASSSQTARTDSSDMDAEGVFRFAKRDLHISMPSLMIRFEGKSGKFGQSGENTSSSDMGAVNHNRKEREWRRVHKAYLRAVETRTQTRAKPMFASPIEVPMIFRPKTISEVLGAPQDISSRQVPKTSAVVAELAGMDGNDTLGGMTLEGIDTSLLDPSAMSLLAAEGIRRIGGRSKMKGDGMHGKDMGMDSDNLGGHRGSDLEDDSERVLRARMRKEVAQLVQRYQADVTQTAQALVEQRERALLERGIGEDMLNKNGTGKDDNMGTYEVKDPRGLHSFNEDELGRPGVLPMSLAAEQIEKELQWAREQGIRKLAQRTPQSFPLTMEGRERATTGSGGRQPLLGSRSVTNLSSTSSLRPALRALHRSSNQSSSSSSSSSSSTSTSLPFEGAYSGSIVRRQGRNVLGHDELG